MQEIQKPPAQSQKPNEMYRAIFYKGGLLWGVPTGVIVSVGTTIQDFGFSLNNFLSLIFLFRLLFDLVGCYITGCVFGYAMYKFEGLLERFNKG